MSEQQQAPDRSTPGWRVVATREIAVKLRDKAFVGSTVFLLVAVIASVVVSALLGGRTSTSAVAVVDERGATIVQAADERARQLDEGPRLEVVRAADVDAAQQALADESADVALLPLGSGQQAGGEQARWELVGQRSVGTGAAAALAEQVRLAEVEVNAQQAGTTGDQALAGTQVAERVVDTSGLPEGLRVLLAAAFAFVFYITALVFGLAIAQSVIEEKQSRVVEILAAAMPVRQLLWGKVAGNTLLAIGQVVLLAGAGLGGLALTGQAQVLGLVVGASAWFVVFFLLGFVALACIWAVAGSVATRQEELQTTTQPVQVVVLVALFIGLLGSGNVLLVASYVPLVSSVAMPARLLEGDVPLWEPLLSAGLVVVTAVLLVRLGARLYEGSLLRTDRRTTLRDALRGG